MPSEKVKETILRLRVDEATFKKGLSNIAMSVEDFKKKVSETSSKSFEGMDKTTESISKRLSDLTGLFGKFGAQSKSVDQLSTSMVGVRDSALQTVEGFKTMEGGVGALTRSFSFLETTAMVALGNIASVGIQKLMSAIQSFTLQPIVQGFREYERELESTRVLIAALGEEALPNIKKSMRELEEYASTTRYNSQDMNSFLAQMVNAGIDLEEATVAIQGTGNLAASGAASKEAYSSAMQYGLTQALQMGSMNLQNWRSLQNSQMATNEFKQVLIEKALELQTITQETLDAYGFQNMFNEALAKEDWMTNDVLMGALTEYATNEKFVKMAANINSFKEAMESAGENVQNTWSKVWLTVFGDGNDVAKIWTPFAEGLVWVMDGAGQVALSMAEIFKEMDGLSSLVALVSTAFNSFKMVVEAVGRAFDNVFPDSRTKIVAAFISSIDDLTKKLALNERVAGAVESVFTALFNVVKALLGVILPLGVYIERLIPDSIISNAVILLGVVADLLNMFFDLFGVIASSLFNFKSLDEGVSGVIGVFTDFYALIESFIHIFADFVKSFTASVPAILKQFLDNAKSGKDAADGLTLVEVSVRMLVDAVGLIPKTFSLAYNAIKTVFDWFGSQASSVNKWFKDNSETIDRWQQVFTKALLGVGSILTTFGKVLLDSTVGVFGVVTDYVVKFGSEFVSLIGNTFESGIDKIYNYFEGDNIFNRAGNPFKTLTVHANELETTVDKSVDNINKQSLNPINNQVVELTKNLTMGQYSISDFVDGLSSMASSAAGFFALDNLKETLKSTNDWFVKFATNVRERTGIDIEPYFKSIAQLGLDIATIVMNIPNAVQTSFSKMGEMFGTGWEGFVNLLKWIGENSGKIFQTLGEFIGSLAKPLEEIGKLIGSLFDGFTSVTDDDTVVKSGLILMLLTLINNLRDGEGVVDRFTGAIKRLFKSFTTDGSDVLTELAKTIKSYRQQNIAKTIKDIGLAMLFLAGAMVTMSLVPSDKVDGVIKMLVSGIVSLTSAFIALELVRKKLAEWQASKTAASGASGSSKSILQPIADALKFPGINDMARDIGQASIIMAMATAVLIIVRAVKKITDEKPWDLVKGIAAVSAIILGISGAVRLAGNGGSMGGAFTILSMVVALWIISKVAESIGRIPSDVMNSAMLRITDIGLAITAALAIMGYAGKVTMGSAFTILALMVAVNSIVKRLEPLSKLDQNQIKLAAKNIGLIMLPLGLAVGLMGGEIGILGDKFKVKWGQVNLGTAGVMISMMFMIMTLADVVKRIAKIPQEDINKASGTIQSLLFTLTAAMALMGGNVGGKDGFTWGNVDFKTFAVMTGLIVGIIMLVNQVTTLAELSKENSEGLNQGTIVIGALAATLVSVVGLYGLIESKFGDFDGKDIFMVATVIIGLMFLGGLAKKLGEMPLDDALQGVGSIIGIVAALALATYALGSIKSVDWSVMVTMVLMGSIVWIIGTILQQIAGISGIPEAALSIGGIVLAMGIAAALFNMVGQGGSGLATIGIILAMAVAVAAAGWALSQVAGLPIEGMIAATVAIVVMLGLIGLVAGLLGSNPLTVAALFGIAVAFAGIGVAAIGMGLGLKLGAEGLTILWELLKTVVDDINNGRLIIDPEMLADTLESVMRGILEFLGRLPGLALEYGGKFLVALGEGIVNAITGLVGVLEKVWNTIVKFFTDLGGACVKIGKDILKWIGDGLSDVGAGFTSALQTVTDTIFNLFGGADVMDKASKAGKKILDNFVKGFTDSVEWVGEQVSTAVEKVKGFFPASPAKHGPFALKGWNSLSSGGRSVMERFINGIVAGGEAGLPAIETAMSDIRSGLDVLGDIPSTPIQTEYGVTPVIDFSKLQTYDVSSLTGLNVQNGNLTLRSDYLDASYRAQVTQNRVTEELLVGIDDMNRRLDDLTHINDIQAEYLRDGMRPVVMMDKRVVSKELAPNISTDQLKYQQRLDKLDGKGWNL